MITTKKMPCRVYGDKVIPKPHPRGSDVIEEVRLHRDVNGTVTYTHNIANDKSLTDYVNSFEAGASLKSMLERCSLMPTRDKIAYFQQNVNGFSADISEMPTDFTAAYLQMQRVNRQHPDFIRSIRGGMSFNDAIKKHFLPKVKESEVINNGETESSSK